MERITVEGEIDNYYVFKQYIIADLTIPKYQYTVLPYNYTYSPISLFYDNNYNIAIIKGINGANIFQVGLANCGNYTFYIYDRYNNSVYPVIAVVKYFVITGKGVETPFKVLTSFTDFNYSVIIVNDTYALIITNNTILSKLIRYITSSLDAGFIIFNGKPISGYAVLGDNLSVNGVYTVLNALYTNV
ncbi:MAG: hypothetical protein QW685_07060 [Saccharolobus sp.]